MNTISLVSRGVFHGITVTFGYLNVILPQRSVIHERHEVAGTTARLLVQWDFDDSVP